MIQWSQNNKCTKFGALVQHVTFFLLITRLQCKKERDICHLRTIRRESLELGEITPLQYLFSLRETINDPEQDILESDSDSNDDNTEAVPSTFDRCVVCLEPRNITIMFLPYQHYNTCQNCSDILVQIEGRCPVCRTQIEQRLIAYQ